MGPNTEPCGTPHVKDLSSENDWFTVTCWVLSVRYEQKPLMSSTGNAHLIVQSRQETFMVSGV